MIQLHTIINSYPGSSSHHHHHQPYITAPLDPSPETTPLPIRSSIIPHTHFHHHINTATTSVSSATRLIKLHRNVQDWIHLAVKRGGLYPMG
jgi:hypothetical protein